MRREMRDKPLTEQDWREVPRSEMFSRVLVATDCARIDAIANGETDYPRYVEEQLWPFLEAEKEAAKRQE
jgi:hypothetical protein